MVVVIFFQGSAKFNCSASLYQGYGMLAASI